MRTERDGRHGLDEGFHARFGKTEEENLASRTRYPRRLLHPHSHERSTQWLGKQSRCDPMPEAGEASVRRLAESSGRYWSAGRARERSIPNSSRQWACPAAPLRALTEDFLVGIRAELAVSQPCYAINCRVGSWRSTPPHSLRVKLAHSHAAEAGGRNFRPLFPVCASALFLLGELFPSSQVRIGRREGRSDPSIIACSLAQSIRAERSFIHFPFSVAN